MKFGKPLQQVSVLRHLHSLAPDMQLSFHYGWRSLPRSVRKLKVSHVVGDDDETDDCDGKASTAENSPISHARDNKDSDNKESDEEKEDTGDKASQDKLKS